MAIVQWSGDRAGLGGILPRRWCWAEADLRSVYKHLTWAVCLRNNQFLSHTSAISTMAGHIAKVTGPDPDPSPWLAVSDELKKNKAKPYDPKKSVWVPNKSAGGYLECMVESKDGAKVTDDVGGEKKVYKEDQVCQINPPKFDCSEDMADLTYLGDACVLWNSVVRYQIVLHRNQSIQVVPHLHPPHHGAVYWQEA